MIDRKTAEKLFVWSSFNDDEPPRDLHTRLIAIGAIVSAALGNEPNVPLVITGQGTSEQHWQGEERVA